MASLSYLRLKVCGLGVWVLDAGCWMLLVGWGEVGGGEGRRGEERRGEGMEMGGWADGWMFGIDGEVEMGDEEGR